MLRALGHETYDFRNPAPTDSGFSWTEIDPFWQAWTPGEFCDALKSPEAERGYAFDMAAMEWADTFVLLLPCGKSAHLELGWAAGKGKETIVLLSQMVEPELMYKMCDVLLGSVDELADYVGMYYPAFPIEAI
jgi:hypothetical protein